MSLVRIVASEPVFYSLDNGVTTNQYDPGEFYQVPDWVGAGMVRRGWAKLVKAEDLPVDEPTDVDLVDLRRTKQQESGT